MRINVSFGAVTVFVLQNRCHQLQWQAIMISNGSRSAVKCKSLEKFETSINEAYAADFETVANRSEIIRRWFDGGGVALLTHIRLAAVRYCSQVR